MHIPDGYLGPATCAATYALMAPAWAVASRKVNETLKRRQVPVLALTAAFSFLVMMFNVPIPGGTTGHAVGAVLVAILLGPWAAVIVVTLVLVVQALVFGDGGLTALGANALDMALVMPFVGWWVFRLVAGRAPVGSRRRWIGAAFGGYVALNAGALATAVLLGLQPALAHDAAGHALYAPYGLSVAVPAMAIGHLLVFGFVEGALTGLVVAWLDRVEPAVFAVGGAPLVSPALAPAALRPHRGLKRALVGLGVLAVLTPLGLFLPELLGAGAAWGEWSPEEVGARVGYVPQGLAKLAAIWKAPLPDYAPGSGAEGGAGALWYVASAVIGAAILAALVLLARRLFRRKEARHAA